jgi:methionyl-tRNA formyltransferase
MYVSSKLDSGDIIYTAETEIGEFETSGQLLNRLRDMGAELLCKTVADIEKGVAPRTPQNHSQATYVTPLDKSMSPIEWNKSPREIVKWICGLNPWPVATAEFNGRLLRIFSAEYTRNRTEKSPGEIVAADNRGLEVACSGGQTLLITELQAPGGKRMSAADYLRGHPIPVGEDKP